MNLNRRLLGKGLSLFLLVSPAVLVLLPKEINAEPGNQLDVNEEDSLKSPGILPANLQAQRDKYLEILEKLRSIDQFMKRMNGAPEKLNELYTFLPLLQQLKKERLEQELFEQQQLEQQRQEQQRLEQQRLEQRQTEQQRLEQQQTEQQRLEQQRQKQQLPEPQRPEQQQTEPQRLEQQLPEQQLPEPQRLEQQLPEPQRLEQQRLEQKQPEQQRLEQQHPEQHRLEQQRPEQQRLERDPMERQELIGKMMKSPHAKLYTGTNLTGYFAIYDFNSASYGKGCHDLRSYSGRIKSIDTEGTCVRLFSVCGCGGWSQAFYPGIDGNNSIDWKLYGVHCIGPCSPNELDDAEIKGSGSELTVRKGEDGVPDLIGDWSTMPGLNLLYSSPTSIRYYNLGVGNRLEGVRADIYPKHLRSPKEAEHVKNMGRNFTDGRFQLDEDREEVGFAIPLELGGVSDQLYNIFPQDKAAAVKYHPTFVPVFKEYLQKNPDDYVILHLRFFYENATVTKPRGIWYRYQSNTRSWGYLFNNCECGRCAKEC